MLQSKDIEWSIGLNKMKEPAIFCLYKMHFTVKDIHRLKVKGWKNIF